MGSGVAADRLTCAASRKPATIGEMPIRLVPPGPMVNGTFRGMRNILVEQAVQRMVGVGVGTERSWCAASAGLDSVTAHDLVDSGWRAALDLPVDLLDRRDRRVASVYETLLCDDDPVGLGQLSGTLRRGIQQR